MGEAAEMLGGHRAHVSSVARSVWRRRQVAPKGLPSRVLTDPITRRSILAKEPIMATLTISLSDEKMRRLEALGKREGLTTEQIVRLALNDLISQPELTFRASAKRVMEENSELYRRLS